MLGARREADAIVIGAGAGGLTAAAYLGVMGRRVVVVDRQSMPGGNTSMFTRDGHQFDIGVHYLGCWRGFHPGVRAVLEPLGIALRYRELDPDGFDEIHLADGMTFRVPRGVEEYRARLYDAFPDERLAIDRYLRRAMAISAEIEAMAPVDVGLRSLVQMPWRMPMTSLTSRMTLGREFDRLGCSPRLRVVLGWAHAYYGLAPSRAALAIHATGAITYIAGTFYPEGGGAAIVDALVDVVREHGGEILCDAEVEQILVDGDGVRGVRLADGGVVRELRAPVVVSAADIKHTYLELLRFAPVRARTVRRVRGYRMATPMFVVYLVLDRDLRAEGTTNHNWGVYADDDIEGLYAACERGEFPAGQAYITSPSLKDPANRHLCGPGQTNVEILGLAPAGHDFWGDGAAYARRKEEVRDALLAAAERAIPGLTASIAHEETASPLTWERHLRNSGGTGYGIAATPDQYLLRRPGPRTRIPGLYLAGASTRNGHGVLGVALGGMEAAAAVTGSPPWPDVRS